MFPKSKSKSKSRRDPEQRHLKRTIVGLNANRREPGLGEIGINSWDQLSGYEYLVSFYIWLMLDYSEDCQR